jgi:hypothetical protein
VDPAAVAKACGTLSHWAEARGYPAVALAFAQAAALAAPQDASHALRTGRLARNRGEYARAEAWIRRAQVLARRASAWEALGLSWLALGNLYVRRGNLPKARRYLEWRYRQPEVVGRACHDLFALCLQAEEVELAEVYAMRAAHAYGRRHPLLPRLAVDTAGLLLLQEEYEHAISVLVAAKDRLASPDLRLLSAAHLAYAAGQTGQRERFQANRQVVDELVRWSASGEGVSIALFEVAQGAAALGEVSTCERYLGWAQELASRRGERLVDIAADRLRRSVTASPGTGRHDQKPEVTAELVQRLVQKLAAV